MFLGPPCAITGLPEATSGVQFERGLGLLIDRLLARRERRGRTLRAVVLSAVLVERGGTWRERGASPRGAARHESPLRRVCRLQALSYGLGANVSGG